MAEDVSMAIRIAITVILAAALLASVTNVSIQLINWLGQTRDKTELLANHGLVEMQNLQGEELNGAQLYKYVMNNYDYITSITVRLNPSEEPNDYYCLCAKNGIYTNANIESALTARYDAVGTGDRLDYAETNRLINEYPNDKFKMEVNQLVDGTLEVIGDRIYVFKK